MTETKNIDHLYQVYAEELKLAEQIQDLLDKEEVALRSKDTESIQNCTQEKSSLLNSFEDIDQKRQSLLRKPDLASDKFLADQHQKLKSLLESIQHKNQINAGILRVSHDFTHQILNILRGVTPGQATYDSLGNSLNQSGNQSLAKV